MMENIVHKKIDRMVFGLLSPKQIQKMAAVKVVTPELYDREGYPVDGGLMNVRLGVIDPGLKCKTCGGRLKECVGHFGYIELARPIIHYKFVRFVTEMLRSFCRHCGRILVAEEALAKYEKVMARAEKEEGMAGRRAKTKLLIKKLKSRSKCPHCNKAQGKIVLEKPTTFYEEDAKLSPIEVRSRLEKIPDNDLRFFGVAPEFARPEWMILTILPIPPVTIRPSITLESGERSEDDLTHKLGDVVRINQRLFENINAGAPEVIIEDLWELLQYHVTTFFDNEVPQIPPARHRGGQPLKTISARIKSKEGRIRHNLAGKRTNFSARTVISPDPNLSLSEVGVPLEIATKLTIPERVTSWNLAYLKSLVNNGPLKYPGANYIMRPDGKKKRITDETKTEIMEELAPGYVVERHIYDGDISIFNRQPSLHRMSMMCHLVRVLPNQTLRMNPAVCNPYNADFDGDEMNLHIPQTEEARAEAEILMLVETQLISPRYGLSVMGCKQDAVTGSYVLTRQMSFTREEAIDMLAQLGFTDFGALPKGDKFTGNQLFSCLLPKDFNFTGTTKQGTPVRIRNGIVEEGFMDAASLGEEKGLVLRAVHEEYGSSAASAILKNAFSLAILALVKRGFTVGIADTDLPDTVLDKIGKVIDDSVKHAFEHIATYERGELEAYPGRTLEETLELKILEVLNVARTKSGSLALAVEDETNTLIMAKSGGRGNVTNIAQITAVVGQQSLSGKRISRGFKNRTLSCFKPHDLSPSARGFIKHSYKAGLAPPEFFFQAMTGRDSLMDTALRTPKSGYLYRRLSNALQDVKVEYDLTVRDVSGKIIQFRYGEDGLDVSRTENGSINVKRIVEKVYHEK